MFKNRRDAGERLAGALSEQETEGGVVVALPRGGAEVGVEVARRLGLPMDVLLVRKLRAPMQPELAIGAVTDSEDPVRMIDEPRARASGADEAYVEREVAHQMEEIRRREAMYRRDRPAIDLEGRTVILIDDGIATGSTVDAAIGALRSKNVGRIILAVPVASREAIDMLRPQVDELVCLESPPMFYAVGQVYENFAQTSDDQVMADLEEAATA